MSRTLAISGGVIWLVVITLVVLTAHRLERPRIVPPLATVPSLLVELNAARPATGESWVVTKVTSAHHMLVVNIDADRVESAQQITSVIVTTTSRRRFDEVLVYFWPMHHQSKYANRRVQWTPKGGYAELLIGD